MHADSVMQQSDSQFEGKSSRASRTDNRPVVVSRTIGLGLFSLGLGLAEVLAPRRIAKIIGVRPNRQARLLLQALGIREIATGIGLLAQPKSGIWLWSRVAGDIIDLALLGDSLFSPRAQHARLAGAAAAILGVTAVDTASAAQASGMSLNRAWTLKIHVVRAITINRTTAEVYDYWRDLENLPTFMDHLEAVKVKNGTSTWRARGPAGLTIEWDAEVVVDRPNECIGWRSISGTSVPNNGVVHFRAAPGGRGTEVLVDLHYEPPAGAIGAAFAKLFGEEPSQQVAADLRRLKQVLETGEVVHSDASVHRSAHPARPAKHGGSTGKVGR